MRRQEIVKTVMLFCARSSISVNVLIHDSPAEALGRRWGRYSERSQPGRRNT
jgi:hypothetical protein